MTRHLYIHVPFCQQICSFCDFKRIKTNEYETMSTYVNNIIKQVSYTSVYKQYQTIYLGGGTPNHLPNELLAKLLNHLSKFLANEYEFSIECNPDLITHEQAKIFSENKINRVSLGVQSTNNDILKQMNRTHTILDCKKAIQALNGVGINNINCDFIYDLPNTSEQDLINAVNFIANNEIVHASFYALEIKENAILNKQKYKLNLENQENKMVLLHSLLAKAGYQRYEISNWVKNKQFVCKHNLAYWLSHDWKALGYGACGFENHYNYKVMGFINKEEVVDCNKLSEKDYYFQILMMGLRLVDGLNLDIEKYKNAFNFFKEKLTNCQVINNHLQANNIDLLDDVLINLL